MIPSCVSLLLLLLLTGLAGAAESNITSTDSEPGRFIAVFDPSASDSEVQKCRQNMVAKMRKRSLETNQTEGAHQYYAVDTFRAMACETDAQTAAEMKNEFGPVSWVEPVMSTSMPESAQDLANAEAFEPFADKEEDDLKAINRIDNQPVNSNLGANITIYLLDTGCNNHVVFGGRARRAANLVRTETAVDGSGHGTHTAGSAGGDGTGTAPRADIACVKILDSAGKGSTADIIGGFQFVYGDTMRTGRVGKCVVNMSVSSARSEAVNQAANALSGMCAIVTAAGNEATDARGSSPASASNAITVGASNSSNDRLASFSNIGKLLDFSCPGVDVLSADFKNEQGLVPLSGTSMGMSLVPSASISLSTDDPTACPQAAGLCAVAISDSPTGACTQCSTFCLQTLQGMAAQEPLLSGVPADTTPLKIDTGSRVPIAKSVRRGRR
ncbi:hypothetical protein CDD80_4677 [Ophiocordyceps camponoti-rufipedis]|uniref:Peptidase S8/S53 domain-containing protein n=1 Tax=Ophiocordyceps camponoti-rufipedis TaxID=2004952 RepID=A0A2C5YZ78_9HYPO|nr:hypothetical protein CDD80_4677 [Ophiocordyceps camponoti-rufipedis]